MVCEAKDSSRGEKESGRGENEGDEKVNEETRWQVLFVVAHSQKIDLLFYFMVLFLSIRDTGQIE